MTVNGVLYHWMPRGEDVYLIHPGSSHALGRITKTSGLVTLSLAVCVSSVCHVA
jgi:hypothetical protein